MSEAWKWVRDKLAQLLPHTDCNQVSDEDFIFLQFPADTQDPECVWLLGNYIELVELEAVAKKKEIKTDILRGFLYGRLKATELRAVKQLNLIL